MTGLPVSHVKACIETAAYFRLIDIEDADITGNLKKDWQKCLCTPIDDLHIIACRLRGCLTPSNFPADELSKTVITMSCVFGIKVKYLVQLWSNYG